MKRRQLIEWGIITIGLICAYKFVENISYLVMQIIIYGFEGNVFNRSIVPLLIMLSVYAISFMVLLRNSGRIAIYFERPGNEENVPFKIGKRSLLQVILIGIGLAAIISKIDDILLYLFHAFKTEAGGDDPFEPREPSDKFYQFKLAAIQTLVAVVVIIFAKDISKWFVRNDSDDELVFDSETEK